MSNNQDFELNQVFNIKGKVALVTGGGSGIGLMCTQALAVNGAKVYIVGRTDEKLERVVETHGKDIQGEIVPITGDVTDQKGVEQLVKEISNREKHLDILINNAGIAPGKASTHVKTAEELSKSLFNQTSPEEWSSIHTTNVAGPYLMSTAFLPLLQKGSEAQHGWSSTIINITSISGMVRISQGHFSYNASKAAAIHLNKMLAAEIADVGLKIRVNAIAPGVFPSEMTTQDSDEAQKSQMEKERKGDLPSGRPGNDRDMAGAVLFAVCNQYLNGQNFAVDGGYLISTGT
ncbi:dehydrogenase with different specificitie [Rhizodiscina lignyota]|uniref:Dehydrogenase with different specificitie n=1 Tax=Rhizodiscina lignyota TaxID=1504668 RepID=A0A9P4IS54_9PEZI|nr:dehydrogenase with different specificitie [Rhizodiscina lignyota]